jgi:hypothetical protein
MAFGLLLAVAASAPAGAVECELHRTISVPRGENYLAVEPVEWNLTRDGPDAPLTGSAAWQACFDGPRLQAVKRTGWVTVNILYDVVPWRPGATWGEVVLMVNGTRPVYPPAHGPRGQRRLSASVPAQLVQRHRGLDILVAAQVERADPATPARLRVHAIEIVCEPETCPSR